jgi:hypothetical protein
MARVLFDSAHNEYLRLGKYGCPYFDVHPERLDWQELAISISKCGYELAIIDSGTLPADLKNYCDILVIADPESLFYHSWPINPASADRGLLLQHEINNIISFVREGGGLLVIQEKYGDSRRMNNLNDLVRNFGIKFHDETIESDKCYDNNSKWIIIDKFQNDHEIIKGIQKVVFFEGCSMLIDKDSPLTPIAYTDNTAHPHNNAPAIAAGNYGKGKVICMGDATIFTEQGLGKKCDNSENHFRLLWNILRWLTPIKGLSNNFIITYASDVLLPIAINKIERIESRNHVIDKIMVTQETNIKSVEENIQSLSSEISIIKDTIEQLNSNNRGTRLLDIISDIILMFSALSLTFVLNDILKNTPNVAIILILSFSILAAVLIKIFWIQKKKSRN